MLPVRHRKHGWLGWLNPEAGDTYDIFVRVKDRAGYSVTSRESWWLCVWSFAGPVAVPRAP